jgi:diguanylate cyclase (GGDEF)-like protein
MKPSYRRRALWRLAFGPLLTLATAGLLLVIARAGVQVPVPGVIMLVTVCLSAYVGGALPGYLSAAIGVNCGLAFLSAPDLLFTPDREFRQQLTVAIGLIAPAVVVFLRTRLAGALERERALRERAEAANHELRTLRAELVRHAQKLERLATIDDLTGLYNRRHFLALAEDERCRHALEQSPMAILIFDIDLFKSVNDRFGHDAGDAVIRHVADVCRNEVSRSDILARIGGEEFALLLPATTAEQAVARADAMRQRLEATPFEVDGAKVRVTVSIGVAEAAPPTDSIGDLMKRADQALYQAKRDGRNRVKFRRASPQRAEEATVAAAAAAA